jgi:hypothetical protein
MLTREEIARIEQLRQKLPLTWYFEHKLGKTLVEKGNCYLTTCPSANHRVPLAWLPDNEDVRKLRLSSRPCPVPADTSNWTRNESNGLETKGESKWRM